MEQTTPAAKKILVDSGSADATIPIAYQLPVKILYIDPDEFSFGRPPELGQARVRAVARDQRRSGQNLTGVLDGRQAAPGDRSLWKLLRSS